MKYKKSLLGFLCGAFLLSQQYTLFGQEVLRPDAGAFPDRTIIIGTYAIVIDQMTNAVLEKAEASAQLNQQMHIYFKSDINEGTWYDITESTDVSEISNTLDNVVSYEQINSILLTHYVDEKGELIDLSTGKATNITQIEDMSYPENMPELEGIEEELQIQKGMKERGSSEGTQAYESIMRILEPLAEEKENATEAERQTIEQLQSKQKQLETMEKYIAQLKQEGGSIEKINEAENQKKSVENQKNLYCYEKVLERIDTEMTLLDYNKNASLIEKYAQYATNIQQAISSLDATTVTETSTTLQKMLFETEQSFQKFASEGIKASADNGLERILAIKKAMLGEVPATEEEKQQQKQLLEEVKKQSEQTVIQLAESGCQGEAYQRAMEYGEPESVLQQKQTEALLLLNIALDDMEVALNQMEKLYADEAVMAEQYAQGANAIEKAMDNINEDSFVAQQIEEALQRTQSAFEQKSDFIRLNQLEGYKVAKAQRDTAQKQAEQKQQQYLSAAEQNNTEALEDIKKERDMAIQALQQAEENMEGIEQAFLNGKDIAQEQQMENATKQLTEESSQQQSETEQSKQQQSTEESSQQQSAMEQSKQQQSTEESSQQQSETEQSKQQQPAEESSQQQSATEQSKQQQSTEESSQQQSATEQSKQQQPAEESPSQPSAPEEGQQNNTITIQREDNYTQQQKEEISAVIEQLQAQTGEEFLPPWHILFQDDDVKLLSPLWNTKNGIYVPAQELVRQLGANVYKSKTDSTYVLKDNGLLIEYRLGIGTIFVNDKEMTISPPPTVYHNRVYMPLEVFERAYAMEHMQQGNDIIVYRI